MKLALIALACMAAVAHAQFRGKAFPRFPQYQTTYQPQYQTTYRPQYQTTYRPQYQTTYRPQYYQPEATTLPPARYVQSNDAAAQTVRFENEASPEGGFNYAFETSNGIAAQEQGSPRNFGGNPPVVPVVAQGSFSWTSPEGQRIAISYTADENGYQPTGDAIPTPPPVPPQIARALAYLTTLKK